MLWAQIPGSSLLAQGLAASEAGTECLAVGVVPTASPWVTISSLASSVAIPWSLSYQISSCSEARNTHIPLLQHKLPHLSADRITTHPDPWIFNFASLLPSTPAQSSQRTFSHTPVALTPLPKPLLWPMPGPDGAMGQRSASSLRSFLLGPHPPGSSASSLAAASLVLGDLPLGQSLSSSHQTSATPAPNTGLKPGSCPALPFPHPSHLASPTI